MPLTYDYSNLPPAADMEPVYQAQRVVREQWDSLGFTRLPGADIGEVTSLAAAIREEGGDVLVIGIGGSDLGARAVHRALNHQHYNLLPADRRGPRLFFIGDTTDPQPLEETLAVVDLRRTTVIVISKSGGTIEQMATLLVVRQRLIEAAGEDEARRRIVAVTGRSGDLRAMAAQEGWRTLAVPEDVGGRFSVLSSVGLLPLAVTGIEVQQLLDGARELAELRLNAEDDPAAMFALHQYEAARRGQPISVLMPYAYALGEFGRWYRQLWAESLGKREDLAPTPVAALGPTDQHSQLQLYMQGPKDKVITFMEVADGADLEVPRAFDSYLGGHSLREILKAERASTAAALAEAGRPNATIAIERLDARHLGALIWSFELATAYSGQLYGINAYDQPGVERSKELLYCMLGRDA